MKLLPSLLLSAACWMPIDLHAQGSLTPPGAPAPGMKSLQEIWDKLEAQETRLQTIEEENDRLGQQNQTLLNQLAFLIEGTNTELPWRHEVVDDLVSAPGDTFLAVGMSPDGVISVAYLELDGPDTLYFSSLIDGSWQREVITQDFQGAIAPPSLDIGYNLQGNPIVMMNADLANVRFFLRDHGVWSLMTSFPTPGGLPVDQSSMAITPDGHIGCVALTADDKTMYYGVYDGSWSGVVYIEHSGTNSRRYQHPDLAYTPDGQFRVSFARYFTDSADRQLWLRTSTGFALALDSVPGQQRAYRSKVFFLPGSSSTYVLYETSVGGVYIAEYSAGNPTLRNNFGLSRAKGIATWIDNTPRVLVGNTSNNTFEIFRGNLSANQWTGPEPAAGIDEPDGFGNQPSTLDMLLVDQAGRMHFFAGDSADKKIYHFYQGSR